jgi:hypothetical protein
LTCMSCGNSRCSWCLFNFNFYFNLLCLNT